MLETVLGSVIGFSLFTITSRPNSPVGKKLPQKKVGWIHLTPEFRLHFRNTFIHLHHWIICAGLYVVAQMTEKSFLHSDIVQGFLIGSVAQGLSYEDRFMMFYSSTQQKIRGKKDFLS